MISFWLICAVMIIVALLFILPSLLQQTESDNSDQVREANLSVYRDQLRELENDLTNGLTSQKQYAQDREEIERRLLLDVGSDKKNLKAKAAPFSRNLAYVVGFVLPVSALLILSRGGNAGGNVDSAIVLNRCTLASGCAKRKSAGGNESGAHRSKCRRLGKEAGAEPE